MDKYFSICICNLGSVKLQCKMSDNVDKDLIRQLFVFEVSEGIIRGGIKFRERKCVLGLTFLLSLFYFFIFLLAIYIAVIIIIN